VEFAATAMMENLKSVLDRVESEGIAVLHGAEASAMAFLEQVKQHAIQYPEPIFAILRRIQPILFVKNTALVTRYEDVQEVLSRDQVFQVTYGEKMRIVTGGNDFFLGMQNSPAYERDTAHMRTVMRREDLDGMIVPFVAKTAGDLVSASGGRLDVVKQLSTIVPARWVASYFGCVPPSDAELAAWGTVIFQYLFTDLTNDPAVGSAARDAAAKTRAWIDATITKRKAEPGQKDDVLGRCLKLQNIGVSGMDDLSIRNNLLGLLVGAIPTTSKCCAQALDELLKRPEQLKKAQDAAQAGDSALVSRYVFEALRFNPNNPALLRIAAEDYLLAKGSIHEKLIPKGATVVAATQSAMFDERIVDAPNDFKIDRPAHIYMHWGYGLHTCFGQYVNQVQIPGILQPLLARKNLRRAPGDAGQLAYSGPFPSSLGVEFDS